MKKAFYVVIVLLIVFVSALAVQSRFIARRNTKILDECTRPEVILACRDIITARNVKLGTNTPSRLNVVEAEVPDACSVLREMQPSYVLIQCDYVVMKFGAIAPLVIRGFAKGVDEFGYKSVAEGLWME